MSDWDRGDVYFANVLSNPDAQKLDSHNALERKYQQFFEHFRIDGDYVYRCVSTYASYLH